MSNKKKPTNLKTVIDETTKLPEKQGNGVLKFVVKIDAKGDIKRYSLAYINQRICGIDNGRVLGYDNSHGYHHRHYMGKEEKVTFKDFESIAEKFDKEWRALHDTTKT